MKNNDHLTNRARTRQSVALPSWTPSRSPVKSSRFERHVQKVKRRIGFLIAIGASNRRIKRELGLENVKRYLAHPDVQQAIEEMAEHLYTRAEKRYAALFLKSLTAVEKLLDGKPMPKGYERPSLRAVELIWAAHGRLPQRGGKGDAGEPAGNTYNLNFDRADAKAA